MSASQEALNDHHLISFLPGLSDLMSQRQQLTVITKKFMLTFLKIRNKLLDQEKFLGTLKQNSYNIAYADIQIKFL